MAWGACSTRAVALSLAFPDTRVLLPLFCLTWAWVLEQAVAVVVLVFWYFVLEKSFMDSLLNRDFSKLKLLGIVTDFR